MMLSGAGNFVNRILNGGDSPRISSEPPKTRCFSFSEVFLCINTQNFANIVSCRIVANFQLPKPSSIM